MSSDSKEKRELILHDHNLNVQQVIEICEHAGVLEEAAAQRFKR